jgi:hypothetical protein
MKLPVVSAGGRAIGLVCAVLALAALACGGSVEPTATPLPRPTQKPVATATPVDEDPDPTATRRPTQAPDDTDAPPVDGFTLSDDPYEHENGAFTIRLPVDWEVEPKNHSIFVTSPDGVVAFEISYINVGVPLNDEALTAFIDAVEDNFFATFPEYTVGDYEPQPDGSILVYKTLELSSGVPQTVFSYYQQEGAVVFEQDYWVDTDAMDQYSEGLLAVANSMTFDPDAAAAADVYAIVYTFTGPNDYFEFAVPYGWTYERNEEGSIIADRFVAADNGAFIENLTYDDGQAAADLPAFARQMLADYYGLDDLEVEEEEDQPDGSVRLSWNSASEGLTGETFYETRGNAVLLLSWLVPPDDYDLYHPVWNTLIGSYVNPGAE